MTYVRKLDEFYNLYIFNELCKKTSIITYRPDELPII